MIIGRLKHSIILFLNLMKNFKLWKKKGRKKITNIIITNNLKNTTVSLSLEFFFGLRYINNPMIEYPKKKKIDLFKASSIVSRRLKSMNGLKYSNGYISFNISL